MNALIIEREGLNRERVRERLEDIGFASLVTDWPYRGVEFLRTQQFDLCVINVDRRLDLRRFLRVAAEITGAAPRVIFMSEKRSRDHYNEILVELGALHLISKSVEENGEMIVPLDLLEHTARYMIKQNINDGLKGLFPRTQIQRVDVLGTVNKNDVFAQVEQFAESFKLRARMVQNIVHLCDELVMNVIYNAPHDAEGHYLYRDLPRDQPIQLKDAERGFLEYAFDGQYFGLSALDPFGALSVETVKEYLTRSYREYRIAKGQMGGGMGFLNLFAFASYFEVYVERGKVTRVTVLLNARQGFRHARAVPRSINFWEIGARS